MDDLHLSNAYTPAPPARNEATKPAAKSTRWPWILLLLLLAFIVGLLGNPWFEAQVRHLLPQALQANSQGAVGGAQIAALSARLAALEQRPTLPAGGSTAGESTELSARVAALEARGAAPDAQAADTTSLAQQLTQLEGRLAAIESQQKAQENQLVNLQGQGALLASLQAAVLGLNNQVGRELTQARASIGVVSLRRALDEGRPYAQQLDSISPLVLPTDPDLLVLRRFAASGVPSTFVLRQRFANLLPELQRTTSSPSSNWLDNALAQMRDLVSVKTPDSPQKPGTQQGVLVALRDTVERGNFTGAVQLVRRLPSNMQAQLEPWVQQINQRQAVYSAFERVEAQILSPRALPTLNLSPAPLPAPLPPQPQP
jgi:hypothetical protein